MNEKLNLLGKQKRGIITIREATVSENRVSALSYWRLFTISLAFSP